MARHPHSRTRIASRAFTRRMKPVAHAAMLVLLMGGQEMANAVMTVSVTRPYSTLRASRMTSVNVSSLRDPAKNALPVTDTALTDANGNVVNIAKSGYVTGVQHQTDGSTLSTLDLAQTTQKSIVLFKSFDIGSNAAVTVNMAQANSSALFQISNTTNPSQIFGSLTSNGELFLINQNGILFGKGAQVNVGGLFASALNITEAEYLSGLNNSIGGSTATFQWTDGSGISTYAPETSFVKVAEGAHITTASGGRVFLLGGQVENAGTITTPNGQTVLAAGSSVYLANPTSGGTALYMSEANAKIPTVKGLLVEVNGNMVDGEFATNSGTINTPTGNTTIVGWAVNQLGRINATTSVTQNGSVYLLARSGASGSSGSSIKQATVGGSLLLGEGSAINISPDQTPDASGATLTTAANAVFTASRVELSGKDIEMQSNATIVAPGGTVGVRASQTPQYSAGLDSGAADILGSFVMGSGALIDVSGTTDTTVSAGRNFVTTALLGAQDLKDAPLQKDGPIYRSELTFDIRSGSPILGDTSSYTGAVQKSAGEFLSTGGKVVLSAGSVNLNQGSNINVSGGAVHYTDAQVSPSILIGEDGKRYTLNTAPADVKIVAIVGKESATDSRFGPIQPGNSTPVSTTASGYVDGKSAGELDVYASLALMDGQVHGGTVSGVRQTAGLDALAARGTLRIGTATNPVGGTAVSIGDLSFNSAVMQHLVITADGEAQDDTVSRIAASNINASGFGNVLFTADAAIEQHASLSLPDLSTVKLLTTGQITLGNTVSEDHTIGKATVTGVGITSKGGSVTAAAYDTQTTVSQGVVVGAGSVIDVSGNWVNQKLVSDAVRGAVAGGNISLLSDHALEVQANTKLDVSGGVTVSTAGIFSGTAAGGISLKGLNAVNLGTGVNKVLLNNVQLMGYSLSQGGSLAIKADKVTVSGNGTGFTQNADGDMTVGSRFFSQGGFQSFSLDGRSSLTIASDARIAPVMSVWQAQAAGLKAATGSDVKRFVRLDPRTDIVRNPVNLSFASSGRDAGTGLLTMQTGARIDANPLAKVSFSAGKSIELDGVVSAKGGSINLTLASNDTDAPDHHIENHIALGDNAVLDVSGGVVYTPTGNQLLLGHVYDAGAIEIDVLSYPSLSLYNAAIDIAQHAQLLADGSTGLLDVAQATGGFGRAYTRKTVASNGGSITINAGNGGARLAGRMSAKAGNSTALGGTLSVSLGLGAPDRITGLNGGFHTIKLQNGAVDGAGPVANELTLSAQSVADGGFANLYVASVDGIQFTDDVALSLSGHVRLDAPVLSAAEGVQHVSIAAASTLQIGSSVAPSLLLASLADSTQVSTGGTTTFTGSSGLVDLFGTQATQGFDEISLTSATELRLQGQDVSNVARSVGAFNTQAKLTLNAQQITPTTASDYTINTTQSVTFGPGDANAATPLSAQATLTVNADTINQNGVIRVPFGQISLNATTAINLSDGSVTSVSGEDLLVPYGTTTGGGVTWQYNGANVTTFKGKSVTLNAAGQTVVASQGAKLNLNGGGKLVAWEFVPGPGGSKDIFAGAANGAFAIVPTVHAYAPYDTSILSTGASAGLSLNPAAGNALSLGNTLTFGAGGILPAGTYAILPARYALLPGAFLIQPNSSVSKVALGYVQTKPDGSQILAAVQGVAGSGVAGNAVASAYTVMTSDQARRYSEIRNTDLDTYLTKQATAAGTPRPALMADAGRLGFMADKLLLEGQIQFAHASGARGGQLDIAAQNIHVGDAIDSTPGVLNLSYAQLNATGADSIMLGGSRQDSDANGVVAVNVSSQRVQIDATAGQSLRASDLIVAATDTVKLNDGTSIESRDAVASAQTLSFSGDGALLRVSSDVAASSTRSNVSRAQGSLVLGQNLNLKGGSITAEGTLLNQIDANVLSNSTLSAQALTVGANRIEVGSGASTGAAGQALVINDKLAAQLNKAADLTLRSFSSVDMLGTSQLGSASARSLTIDSAAIRVVGDAAKATLTAGAVTLANTTGAVSASGAGTGTLNVNATGNNGGSGHVTIASGQVAVSGAQTSTLTAAGSVVMQGKGGLTVPGDLSLNAQTLTARQAANGTLTAATGAFTLNAVNGSGVAAASPGAGATVQIAAQSVAQRGRIVLPSGKLTVTSDQSANFGATSVTDLSGVAKTIDGQALSTVGGDLFVTSKSGDINLAQGGVLNVSAGLGKSSAGSMNFSAINGGVNLQGRLLATSTTGQSGGSLSIDAQRAVDIKALAQRISNETAAGVSNFAQAIELRNRQGDLHVAAQTAADTAAGTKTSTILSANKITLSADTGSVLVDGALYANGDAGGTINLNAGDSVTVSDTADLQARALTAGGAGGSVNINAVAGNINLNGGSIDTSGNGVSNGTLSLRALATDDGVRIGTIGTQLTGVGNVAVEAVRPPSAQTTLTVLTNQDLTTFKDDANQFLNTYGQGIVDNLSLAQAGLGSKIQLRTGIELRSDGDLVVVADDTGSGLLMTNAGAPINLTLRAAGDLIVGTGISDGFASNQANEVPISASGNIRLVGGADLHAADVMATVASNVKGDVLIGDPTAATGVIVRTTTGSINIAAGRDVKLLNAGATVYTTGLPVLASAAPNYVKTKANGYTSLFNGTSLATPFLTGGGSISVKAQRDVAWLPSSATPTQFTNTTDWWYRLRNPSAGNQISWWNRYDLFQQGMATFGGGNIGVQAGNDLWDVNASASSSGYVNGDKTVSYGGGNVDLKAGNDVVDGFVMASGDISVLAGGSVRGTSDTQRLSDPSVPASNLSVLYGDGRTSVLARRDLNVANITQVGLKNPATVIKSGPLLAASRVILYRPVGQATLDLASTAGDLEFENTAATYTLPGTASVTAANGSVTTLSINQAPAPQTQLSIMASGNVTTGIINQYGIDALTNVVQTATSSDLDTSHLSGAGSAPTRIVAENGSINYGATSLITPLRMIAGLDITASPRAGLTIRHQNANDLSLIQAGRDYNFSTESLDFGLEVQGPGDLVIATGRNLDLYATQGIQASGNLHNAAITASTSAGITVFNGVNFAAGDITDAVNAFYPLLGGTGIGSSSALLYTDIKKQLAIASNQSVSDAQAQAQADLANAGILDLARSLAGEQAYQNAVKAFVNHRIDASQSAAQALSTFSTASDQDKALVAGQLLSKVWANTVPLQTRINTVLQMVQPGSTLAANLMSFVTGGSGNPITLSDALSQFMQMPVERQALLVTKTLSAEVASAIADAASKKGTDRDAAYAVAYNAIGTVFSDAPDQSAMLNMGASQIKTLKNSPVSVFSPNGGINVGQLVSDGAGSQTAADLGLVTASGGDVAVLVRDDVTVNTSRIFTLVKGDETIWSSLGNVDAGRGAKTVTATPVPVYVIDGFGKLQIDTGSAISGSGIAATGQAHIAAPKGEINAGDAGIKATQGLDLAANVIRGADNIASPVVHGAPPPPSVNLAVSANTPTQPTASGTADNTGKDDANKAKKRKRNVLLDFLGFGSGDDDADKPDKKGK